MADKIFKENLKVELDSIAYFSDTEKAELFLEFIWKNLKDEVKGE